MADGDIVRKITISATGENIDSTRASTQGLTVAVANLTDANKKNSDALRDAINNHESFADKALKVGAVLGVLYGAWNLATMAINNYVDQIKAAIAFDLELLLYIPRKIGEVWEKTTAVLASYVDLAGKAAALGVGTDFYQRENLAADKLKITNDSIIKQMETLNASTKDQLGGSTGQKRVNELVSFGNFSGNSGVDELKNATTSQEKYTAVLSLIKQAQAAGEDLAAIDVAKTFLGAAAADNLLKSRDYLDDMNRAAVTMSSTKLIADADVSAALDLQNRLIIAEDTINKKWFPGQRDGLNPIVMAFKELWVEIVELVAGAFSWVEKLTKSLLSIPASLWQTFQDWRHGGDAQGPQQETPEQALARGSAALRVGMQNPNSVSQSTAQASSLSNSIRKDKSKSAVPDEVEANTAAYDRATEQLLKYIKVTDAAATSVDLGAAAQERAKAMAQLLAGAEKDGTTVTAALTREMEALADRASKAAEALAKARVESSIKFGRNTSLLSQEDVQIATALKGLYPDVATALNSVQAAGMRTNTALSGIAHTAEGTLTTGLTDILDGTKTVSAGFADMSKIVVRSLEEMIVKMMIIQPLMRSLQGAFGGVGGGISDTLNATPWSFPKFASGTDNAPGGWSIVGEKGPEYVNLNPGAKVLPNGMSPDGGGSINAPVNIQIDATGADAAGLARVQQQLAALQTTLPSTIVQTVRKARSSRML